MRLTLRNLVVLCSFVCISPFVFSQQADAVCDYSGVTASLEQSFFSCWAECRTQIPVHMGCHDMHTSNWCTTYCADAYDDTCAGNPINLSNRAKVHGESDYAGPGEFPLTIERYYNSKVSMPSSNFGEKWQGIYSSKIVSTSTASGTSDDVYTVVEPTGRRIQFEWYGGGATTPLKSNTTETLTMYNYGIGGIPQVFQLVRSDGTKEIYEFDLAVFEATHSYESKLMWIETPQGLKQLYSFDGSDRIYQIEDPAGRTLTYSYYDDGTDHIETITAPGGPVFTYEYDASGNLTKVIFPDDTPADPLDNPYKEYLYEDPAFPNHLTGIIDRNGDRFATFAYDAEGSAILSEHAGGADRFEVISYGDDVTVRNGAGKDAIYHFETDYDGAATLRRITGVDGQATDNCVASNSTITYDANGFKDTEKDGRDFYTDYDFNAYGQETRRSEAMIMFEGSLIETDNTCVTETDWTTSGRVEEIRKEGITTTYTYENDRIKTKTDTDTTTGTIPYSTNGTTRTWTYSYTYHDQVEQTKIATITIDGPRSDVNDLVEEHFNEDGFLTRVVSWVDDTNKLESVLSNHTDKGLPQTIVDENNVTTTLTYTALGLLDTRTLVSTGTNAVTDYDYDDVGQVTRITLPNGIVLNYEYDEAHRLTAVSSNTGERMEYELDTFGNQGIRRIKNSSLEIRYLQEKVFNDLGYLWKVIGTEGQELEVNTYDENNLLVNVADANLENIVKSYDGLGRLWTVMDRETGMIEYDYDELGNVVMIEDQQGLVTTYQYDGFSRRIGRTSPDTGDTIYYYDLADNLVSKIDNRGVETMYTYDALNRKRTVEYPATPGENVTFRYDEVLTGGFTNKGKGKRTGITEANGNSIDWIYNDLGQIVKDVRTIGSASYTIEYAYDLAGILTGMIYPSGREVEYQLDSLGRPTSVRTRKTGSDPWTTIASGMQFEPFGPLTTLTFGNGYILSRTYDLHYRPDTILTSDGSTSIQNLEYDFNLNGQIETIHDFLNPERTQGFTFDGNNMLTQASGGYGTVDYSYDGVGNRLTRSGTLPAAYLEDYTYPVDSHRLSSVSSAQPDGNNFTFGYTDVGGISSDGELTFEYNAANRISTVKQGVTTIAEYTHNALGQRVQKTAAGETTHFLFSLEGKLLAESDDSGQTTRDYLYLGDMLLAMIDVEETPEESADLSIVMEGGRAGTGLTYTITVRNNGPDSAEGVSLESTIPSSVGQLDSFDASGGSCQLTTPYELDCSFGDMTNGQVETVNVAGTLVQANDNYEKQVIGTVTSNTPDPILANNTDDLFECFIASAAYGSSLHKNLHVLRDFRDNALNKNGAGRWLVKQYYLHSPPLARWISERETAKTMTRLLLMPVIGAAWYVQVPLGMQVSVLTLIGMILLSLTQLRFGRWIMKGSKGRVVKEFLIIPLLIGVLAGHTFADQTYYVHSDHINTPQKVTNQDKHVVWAGIQLPFGLFDETVSDVRQPIRFPGQYYDEETGLHYNWKRYYHPDIGRYLSPDPVGLEGRMGLYPYALNNPYELSDPAGEFAIPLQLFMTISLLMALSIMIAQNGIDWPFDGDDLIEERPDVCIPQLEDECMNDPSEFVRICMACCQARFPRNILKRYLCYSMCIANAPWSMD